MPVSGRSRGDRNFGLILADLTSLHVHDAASTISQALNSQASMSMPTTELTAADRGYVLFVHGGGTTPIAQVQDTDLNQMSREGLIPNRTPSFQTPDTNLNQIAHSQVATGQMTVDHAGHKWYTMTVDHAVHEMSRAGESRRDQTAGAPTAVAAASIAQPLDTHSTQVASHPESALKKQVVAIMEHKISDGIPEYSSGTIPIAQAPCANPQSIRSRKGPTAVAAAGSTLFWDPLQKVWSEVPMCGVRLEWNGMEWGDKPSLAKSESSDSVMSSLPECDVEYPHYSRAYFQQYPSPRECKMHYHALKYIVEIAYCNLPSGGGTAWIFDNNIPLKMKEILNGNPIGEPTIDWHWQELVAQLDDESLDQVVEGQSAEMMDPLTRSRGLVSCKLQKAAETDKWNGGLVTPNGRWYFVLVRDNGTEVWLHPEYNSTQVECLEPGDSVWRPDLPLCPHVREFGYPFCKHCWNQRKHFKSVLHFKEIPDCNGKAFQEHSALQREMAKAKVNEQRHVGGASSRDILSKWAVLSGLVLDRL